MSDLQEDMARINASIAEWKKELALERDYFNPKNPYLRDHLALRDLVVAAIRSEIVDEPTLDDITRIAEAAIKAVLDHVPVDEAVPWGC